MEKDKDRLSSNQIDDLAVLIAPKRDERTEATITRLTQARDKFYEIIAGQLEGPLNAHLAALAPTTTAEKQEVAKWTNGVLRTLGLAVRCSKSNQPAMLHVDPSYRPNGRFQVELIDRNLGRKRTMSSVTLPSIELCQASQRREALAEFWANRISNKGKERF